jgi:hypothetical protein
MEYYWDDEVLESGWPGHVASGCKRGRLTDTMEMMIIV